MSDPKERRRKRRSLLNRYGNECFYCVKPMDLSVPNGPNSCTLEHLIPISKGGKHCLDNLHLAHKLCNVKRGNRPLIMVRIK